MTRTHVCLIVVFFILIIFTIITEVSIKVSSKHILNFHNNTAPLNSSAVPTQTPQERPPCSDSNWSRASAWWFLAGLAIACISLPRGSLNFHRSSRVWRLSPIFLLVEDLTILLYIIDGLSIYGRSISNFRLCCLSILATREGNAWSQDEHDKFFAESADRHFKFGVGELYGAMFPGLVESGIELQERQITVRESSVTTALNTSDDPPPSPVSRRTTANLEEGRRVQHEAVTETGIPSGRVLNEGGSACMEDWFTIGKLTGESLSNENATKTTQLLDYRFFHNIQQIQNYEKGPTYRILLWLPILQNFSKAFLVRGSSFTVAVGFIYLVSFFLIEGLRLAATRDPKSGTCREALYLMRQWGNMKRVPRHPAFPRTRDRVGLRMEPKRRVFWEFGWVFISATLNIILFSKVFGIAAFSDPLFSYSNVEYNSTGKLEMTWLPSNWFGTTIKIILIVVMIISTVVVMLAFWILAIPIGSLLPVVLSTSYALSGRDFAQKWSLLTRRDLIRFAPVFSALTTAILAFVAYWGIGPREGMFYDCLTTQKKAFYDYLG